MVTTSAPGKLMLFGEHAVIYGHPCIVAAVNKRLSVTVEKTTSGAADIIASQVNNTAFVKRALQKGVAIMGISHSGLRVLTSSSFSQLNGFGSSSAVTVSCIFALSQIFQKNLSKKDIFDISYDVICSVQNVGSGFDAAAAVFGGVLYFVKGGSVIKPLQVDFDGVSVVVGYTGKKADTAGMIEEVRRKKEAFPQKIDRIFSAIGAIVDEAKEALATKDWETVGKRMNYNQEYLRDLGVSCEELEALISASMSSGALGAKLSGAGGGDCMIALVENGKKSAVEEAIAKAGGEVVDVALGEEGVRVER